MRIKGSLHVLKVVNDLAEQCVKDIQEYADLAKDSHYQRGYTYCGKDHRVVLKHLRERALAV